MSIELHDLGQLELEEGDPATAASTSASQGADPVMKIYWYSFFFFQFGVIVIVKLKDQVCSVSGSYSAKNLALSARCLALWTQSSLQTVEC